MTQIDIRMERLDLLGNFNRLQTGHAQHQAKPRYLGFTRRKHHRIAFLSRSVR